MSTIIMTESTCDLPREYIDAHPCLEVVPMVFQFGAEEQLDIAGQTDNHLNYERLRAGEVATTSQLNSDYLYGQMKKHLQNGDDVLYLAFSSGLSGTCSNGMLAANELRGEFPERKLTVVDTLDITLTRLLKSRKAGDYEMTYCLTLKNFENELKQKLGDFVVQAKDATVGSYDFDAGDFVFEDAVNGKKLDVYGTLAAVKAQFLKKTSGEVEAALQETAAKVTVDDLRKDFGMISSFETVSTNTENGNHNMGLALSRVNGTVLNPGDTFSYENIVGDSTNASTGFLPAGGLSGGALVQMYGGGICQASSTIYGAALRAGMTITLRDCHSSPSTYVPIGLDATVSYGEIDFQFRNDLDTPVYIMSWMDGVTLHVQFYGKHPKEWDTINVYSQTTSEIPPLSTVKYVVDQNLKKGEKVLSTSGNWGYEASAWRDFVKDGEVIRTETLPSSYYGPSGTIYRIGPGTETSSPSPTPTATPTAAPTATPTPTAAPTPEPTPAPPAEPTAAPTEESTPEPVTAAETGE